MGENECCNNPTCAGFSYRSSDGSGFFKGNQDCGLVTNAEYDGYTKPKNIHKTDISVTFSDVGLFGQVSVYDIWAQKYVGEFQDVFTAHDVPIHGTAFFRLSPVPTPSPVPCRRDSNCPLGDMCHFAHWWSFWGTC